jgi:hypothetical protein
MVDVKGILETGDWIGKGNDPGRFTMIRYAGRLNI